MSQRQLNQNTTAFTLCQHFFHFFQASIFILSIFVSPTTPFLGNSVYLTPSILQGIFQNIIFESTVNPTIIKKTYPAYNLHPIIEVKIV